MWDTVAWSYCRKFACIINIKDGKYGNNPYKGLYPQRKFCFICFELFDWANQT